MRMGWDHNSLNAPELARIAQESGACAVTVHGRTRNQFYEGEADWSFFKQVKDKVSIPVFGNGDITSYEDLHEVKRLGSIDGVFIGRAAQGRPWLLGHMAHYVITGEKLNNPSIAEQYEWIIEHYDEMLSYYGIEKGVHMARKHLGWYTKSFPNASAFRRQVMILENPQDVKTALYDFYHQHHDEKV
jgi:tRNA-dihydrouridine synthase B